MDNNKNWWEKTDSNRNVFQEEDQEKHLKVVSQNNPGGTEENHKNLTITGEQKNWSSEVKPHDTENV
jgi:hypothetical protein